MQWAFEYPFGYTTTWTMIVVLAGVVAASFVMVGRHLWPLSRGVVILVALRLVAFSLIVFLLLRPSVVSTQTEEIKPHAAVLVDASGSMGVVDDGGTASRLEQAVATLEQRGLLDRLREKARVSIYAFSSGASAVAVDSLHELDPAGNTGIGASLDQLRRDYQGENLAGVVVFSDGRENAGVDASAAAIAMKTPVFTVGFGRQRTVVQRETEKDVEIATVSHNQRVVVKRSVDVTITVAMRGFDARTIPVELLRDDEVVATAMVALSPDRPERQVTVQVTPDVPGQVVYMVRVPVDAAEVNKDNNEKPVPITVTDPVPRVLYVEARPRWEFKFLSRVLSAFRNVEHTALVKMGTDQFNIQGSNPAESAQIATMTPGQLQRLKGVIIGDVPGAFFSPEQQQTLTTMVEQGASLVLLAGQESFGPQGFAGTPLAAALPVELSAIEDYDEEEFKIQLTPQGRVHPIFQGVSADWSTAPELISLFPVQNVKPGAVVLMETESGLPVVVVQQFGQGKVAIVLTDSIWRWRLGAAGENSETNLHAVFWQQLIAWMMPTDAVEKERRSVQLVADQLEFEIGDDVGLTLTAMGADGVPATDASVVMQIYTPDGKVIQRDANFGAVSDGDTGSPTVGAYRATFRTHVGGKYRIVASATAPDGLDLGRDEISIVAAGVSIELTEVDPDHDLLRTLARLTQGRYYEASLASRVADDMVALPTTSTWIEKKEVWDRWWVMVVFILVMSGEWILRRKEQLE